MRLIVGVLACLTVAAALADEPTAPAPVTAQPATTPAPAATQAQAAQKPVDDESEAKRLRARGYRLEKRAGNEVWCRKEDTMGTRLGGHTVCRTADQIRYEEEKAKRDVQRIQYNGPNKPAG